MTNETYYSLLEVSETESAAEIKTAYLRMIREVHPDRVANAPVYFQRHAEEKTKEINEAYTVLSNRAKRQLYDAQLASYRGAGTSASGNSNSQAAAAAQAQAAQARAAQPPTPPPPKPVAATPPSRLGPWWKNINGPDKVALIGLVSISTFFVFLAVSASRGTHSVTGPVAGVKIINGSLSSSKVSGHSNEKYPSAYNFRGYIQNNSTEALAPITIKIRIFDCPKTKDSSFSTAYGISYQSGIYDPSPPSSCNKIGEEEEDDRPDAEPGRTSGFANFYFPNYPQAELRWNYEIRLASN